MKLYFCIFFAAVAFCMGGGTNQPSENTKDEPIDFLRSISKTRSLEANWQKLAVDPEPWYGKEIELEGWVSFDIGFAQENPNCPVLIYESRDAMENSLRARSLELTSEEFEAACENTIFPRHATALMLQGKLIRIRGTCEANAGTFSLFRLDDVAELRVFRTQATSNFPHSLLNSETENSKTPGKGP